MSYARPTLTERLTSDRTTIPGLPKLTAPPLAIEVTIKTMIAAVAVGAGAWILLKLAPVVLVLVVALFLVGTLNPGVEWLEKKGVRRGFSIALVFTSMGLGFLALAALTIPALVQQIASLVQAEPALRGRLADALSHTRATAALADSLRNIHYEAMAKDSAGAALAYSAQAAEVFGYLVSSIFLALYIMVDRDRLRGGLYALVPRSHHIRLSRVLLNLETIVGGYIRGQVLTSALMGGFTFLLLLVCKVKSALAIGALAGVADVLPYIGVLLSVGPAVGAAMARGPLIAAIVLAAMLAYEELESRFLVPRIYGDALKLPSSVVLFSLLAGGVLMGIPGVLLALPIAAAARMLVEELRVELPGEEIDDSSLRLSDARAEREYEARAAGKDAENAAAIAVEIEERREEREAKEEHDKKAASSPRP